MINITKSITDRIIARQQVWVFSPKDFLDLGSRSAVDKVISRLTQKGFIRKVTRGIYDYPRISPLIGIVSPNIEKLVKVIASKIGDRIFHSGAMATNLLGLSTQVPMKIVYATTGKSCIKKIGNNNITFQHARIPILNDLSFEINLALQSMAYLGKKAIDSDMICEFARKLSLEDKMNMSRAIPFIPAWMRDVIRKIQNSINLPKT